MTQTNVHNADALMAVAQCTLGAHLQLDVGVRRLQEGPQDHALLGEGSQPHLACGGP